MKSWPLIVCCWCSGSLELTWLLALSPILCGLAYYSFPLCGLRTFWCTLGSMLNIYRVFFSLYSKKLWVQWMTLCYAFNTWNTDRHYSIFYSISKARISPFLSTNFASMNSWNMYLQNVANVILSQEAKHALNNAMVSVYIYVFIYLF